VVLLDWQLPDMSGAALARQIRQTPLGRQPHLSLLTAFGREHLFAAATLDGIDSMLGKPVSGSALFEHMMSVLGRSAFQSVPAESVAGEPDALLDLRALRGRRVLLVEDNAINRELGLELLQEQGLRVVTAEHGQQALDLLRAGLHFDLVLMDIQMPVLDGLAATRAIRALPGFAELPILAMTANAMSEDRQRCLDAGMNDFVTKPIDINALWRALLRWLPTRSGPGKRPADPPGAAQPSELPLVLAGPVEGLDTDLGLRRCLGRPDLYLRLLRQFAEGQDQEARQLQVALEQSNWLVAQRLAHTLKSVAANLGALRLQALADSLERAVAAQAPGPPDTQQLLAQGQQVDLATRHLLQQLALALGPAPRYRPVADAPAIAARLPAPGAIAAPLRELLARGDFDALALVVSQANPLRQAMGTQFEPFERALAAFDFDRAIALLDSTCP
jgi:two-component system sensor histidine kinase/response regulator